MNQTLEIQNNKIIFNRAKAFKLKRFGFLNEDIIKQLRNCFLKSTWKIEAKYFRLNRDNLGLSQHEVAESLNISVADLRKLERSVDFADRDILASRLKSFLNIPLN
jgi:DNA-binding transcriptional regulator YiaG